MTPLVLFLLTSLTADTQVAAADPALPPSCIPMQLSEDGRPLLTVDIEGYGPAPFIFDTGASHSAIGRPVLEELGLIQPVDQDVVTLTEQFDTHTVSVRLRLGGLGLRQVEAVSVGVALDEEVFALGLLGADYFTSQRVRLDFVNGLFCTGEPELAYADGTRHPRTRIAVMAGAIANSRPFNVLVDTGATRTIMNTELANLAHNNDRYGVRMSVRGVTGRVERADEVARVRQVRIGGLCAPLLRAPAADLYIFEALGWGEQPALVLGMDALRDTTLIIDFATGNFQLDGSGDLRCDRETRGS